MRLKYWFLVMVGVLLVGLIVGCGESNSQERQHAFNQAEKNRRDFAPYIPHNHVEASNYNRAQELYDNPSTIQWCTVLPPSNATPIVTIPIAGKLTSSSVSAFSGAEEGEHGAVLPQVSVDGLYHGNPPPYRYGFTPGGQYVELSSALPYLCTTQPLSFQRQSVSVKVASGLNAASVRAEAALKQGNKQRAQQILEAATGSGE